MQILDLIGRIFLSLLFLTEGIRKLFIQEQTIIFMEDYGVPGILFIPSVIVEILFPLLLIIGFKIKFSALIMAVFTLTVAIIFHTNFENDMALMFFLKDLAIAGGFLFIFSKEPGKYSLDNKLS